MLMDCQHSFTVLLYFNRVVRRPSTCSEGSACQLPHSSLPHDHQVWYDPQASERTSAPEPAQRFHPGRTHFRHHVYICITRLVTVHNIVMVETISCDINTIYVKGRKLKSQ